MLQEDSPGTYSRCYMCPTLKERQRHKAGRNEKKGEWRMREIIYDCVTDRMSVPIWCQVSEAILSSCDPHSQSSVASSQITLRHSHKGRSSLSTCTHTCRVARAIHAWGLKEQVHVSGDVFPLNVSSGGCKYCISLPVTDQKWEIIMKHEERIILYSCDNISLFHKQTQIFISCEKIIQHYQRRWEMDQKDFLKRGKN